MTPRALAVLTAAGCLIALGGGTSSASLLPRLTSHAAAPAGTAPTPASAPYLRVSGNRIVDVSGRTVLLHGLNRAGTDQPSTADRHPVTDDEIGWLASDHPGSWEANTIRVLMDEAQWTGACPALAADSTSYRAQLDAEVTAITRRGLVAVLDLHTTTGGCQRSGPHAMPAAPQAQTFWKDVAAHYAGNSHVAFELFNEPHWVDDGTWLNGSASATVQDCDPRQAAVALAACRARMPRYRAVGMQELYDLVTAVAPGHLVLADGNAFATEPPTRLIDDRQHALAYALHAYTCPAAACATSTNDHANLPQLSHWVPLGKQAPVVVTELGWPANTPHGYVSGVGYYTDTLHWLATQEPTWGWLAYATDGTTGDAFDVVADVTTYAPNETGRVVFDALRSG